MLRVGVDADDNGARPDASALDADFALRHRDRGRPVVDAGAGRDRRAGKGPHVAHRMELAVVLIDGGALLRHEEDAHRFLPETISALAHVGPLLVIPGDLCRAVPGEVARDAFPGDDLADQFLVVSRKAPNAQSAILAVATCRRDEILGDAGQEKSGVSPARRVGDRASLEHDRLRAGAREVICGRDAGDARTDDRDVSGHVLFERGMVIGRDFVEPDARHFRYSASGAAARAKSHE